MTRSILSAIHDLTGCALVYLLWLAIWLVGREVIYGR